MATPASGSTASAPKNLLEENRAKATFNIIENQINLLFQNIKKQDPNDQSYSELEFWAGTFVKAGNKRFNTEAKEWKVPSFKEVVPHEYEVLYQQAERINKAFGQIVTEARLCRTTFSKINDPNLKGLKEKTDSLIATHNTNVAEFLSIKDALDKAISDLKSQIDATYEQTLLASPKVHIAKATHMTEELINAPLECGAKENLHRKTKKIELENIVKAILENSSNTSTSSIWFGKVQSGSEYEIRWLTEGYKSGGYFTKEAFYKGNAYTYDPDFKDHPFADISSSKPVSQKPAIEEASKSAASTAQTPAQPKAEEVAAPALPVTAAPPAENEKASEQPAIVVEAPKAEEKKPEVVDSQDTKVEKPKAEKPILTGAGRGKSTGTDG